MNTGKNLDSPCRPFHSWQLRKEVEGLLFLPANPETSQTSNALCPCRTSTYQEDRGYSNLTASQQLGDRLTLNLSRTSLGRIRLCPLGFDGVRASQFDCTEVLNMVLYTVPVQFLLVAVQQVLAESTTTGVTLRGKSFAISCSCRLPIRLHARSLLLYPACNRFLWKWWEST